MNIKDLIGKLIIKLFKIRWIIFDSNELGIRIAGINFVYYKWDNPLQYNNHYWRTINKREFGESIRYQDLKCNDYNPRLFNPILNWQDKHLTCSICATKLSVKYEFNGKNYCNICITQKF
jgi:hypothetical protein